MSWELKTAAAADQQTDPDAFAKAILNILEDAALEAVRLSDSESAVLNILEDAADEKARIETTKKAILNILEDAAEERGRLSSTESAVLNILEDAASEKAQIEATQKAVLNILEDTSSERKRLDDTQRAILNILDDFDSKNNEIERVNREMAAEIAVRRQAEEALMANNKELEAFSYSVAHDLRSPLRSIDGFSQALFEDYEDKFDAAGKNYITRIRAATQRMALLIDELLKLARISRSEMHFETLDLSAMARSIVAGLEEAEPQRPFQCIIPDGIMVQGDARSLRSALENLLANAWKFTAKKDRALIEVGMSRENGRAVYFVRDNGAGFDMTYASKLFGVFQRLHSDAEFPGIGIGLAIVQRVVLRHGGRVSAHGVTGEGATFSFTLHETQEVSDGKEIATAGGR